MNEMLKEQILDGIDDKFLQETLQYGRKRKKNKVFLMVGRMAACIAIVAGLSFSTLSIAVAAGNLTAYETLYGLYPEIAKRLMPMNLSCEDAGVRMEVEGVSIQDNSAYIYMSMQDVEENRIDETIDLFDSYSLYTNADQIGNCALVDYEEETGKAMFLITVQQMNGRPIEAGAMSFSVSRFLTGKEENRIPLTQISTDQITEVADYQTRDQLNIRGGSYASDNELGETANKFLMFDGSKSFVPVPGVTVTNYGLIDDRLHVQVYYEDIVHYDNHGYIYLQDAEGNILLPPGGKSFWDADRKGSYEEYIFDVTGEQLENYEIYGHFFTCQNLVEGDWNVKFTISGLPRIEQ